ncbi:MAG: trypsin-like peptidase domain-containing protein [Nitrospinota bacterium]
MKRVKVKSTSIPAFIIMICVAVGVTAFAYLGNDKGGLSLSSLNDNFIVSQIAGDTRQILDGMPAAFEQNPALNSGNVATWIKPAVASIFTTERRLEPAHGGTAARQTEVLVRRRLGTGVVVHSSGYILTNNHIADSADTIMVNIQGFSAPKEAHVEFVDPASNLSILKISVEFPLPVVAFHRPNHLMPGEDVIAVSLNPDLGAEARRAVVSGVNRTIATVGKAYNDLIALDRQLSVSFDGAPLIDRNGFVVGLLGPVELGGEIAGGSGLGKTSMAISAKSIRRFISRYMERAEVPVLVNRQTRGAMPPTMAVQAGMVREAPLMTESNAKFWIGINFQNLEPAQARQYGSPFPKGAMVNFVHPFGPAVSADIQPGDIILKANGRIIRGGGDIEAVVRRASGGDVTLQIFRRGKRMEIKVSTEANPTLGRTIGNAVNVAAAVPNNRLGGRWNEWGPGMDMDQIMANQKKKMLVEKFGLDPSLIVPGMDGDRVMRIARDQLIARKLGIDTQNMIGGGNRNIAIKAMLQKELAARLGINPAMAGVPGFGRDQMAQAVKASILAAELGVDPALSSAPGITPEEIIKMGVGSYLAKALNRTTGEIREMAAPQTAVNNADPNDMDKLMRRQRMRDIAAKLGIDPNLLALPGMGPDRLLKIAGDRYLAQRLGVDAAILSMPGVDRERIANAGVAKKLVSRLGLSASLANNPGVTIDRILKTAENRILAVKLGLPSDIINMPGISRERIIRIAGDRLMSSMWSGTAN